MLPLCTPTGCKCNLNLHSIYADKNPLHSKTQLSTWCIEANVKFSGRLLKKSCGESDFAVTEFRLSNIFFWGDAGTRRNAQQLNKISPGQNGFKSGMEVKDCKK